MKERVLVTDFDGTITRYDFFRLVLEELLEPQAQSFWQAFEAGKLTHFAALQNIFAQIRCSEARLGELIAKMEIDPKFAEACRNLEAHGWSVEIASAGCEWYVRRLLQGQGISVPVYSNPGEFEPESGLLMRPPLDSPFYAASTGVDKTAVVRDALRRSAIVAFAGDGRPDAAPAEMVDPQYRFATGWLAEDLKRRKMPFRPFRCWHEIADTLLGESVR